MSGTKGNTNTRETLRRVRPEAKKPSAANLEASMDDDDISFEESVANTVSKTVTEKIGALMEQKFTELHSTLDKLSSRVEDNVKRITEAENRISDGEDRTTTLENKLTELEQRVKILTDRAEDSENRSRRDNIRILGLKEGTEGNQAVRFFGSWLPEVRESRRQFNGVCERLCERLIQRGLRFQMRYPASLCFIFNGEERSFKSPREAEEFLSKNG
ncbi:unnamed protein product [Leuciscus chuanchicus]